MTRHTPRHGQRHTSPRRHPAIAGDATGSATLTGHYLSTPPAVATLTRHSRGPLIGALVGVALMVSLLACDPATAPEPPLPTGIATIDPIAATPAPPAVTTPSPIPATTAAKAKPTAKTPARTATKPKATTTVTRSKTSGELQQEWCLAGGDLPVVKPSEC